MNTLGYFKFLDEDYEYFVKKAMLNEELAQVLECKIKGYSIVQIADVIHRSERTTNRRVQELNEKIKKVLRSKNDL